VCLEPTEPWNAPVWLTGVVIIFVALSLTIGAHELSVKDYPAQACSAVERVVLGVDTAVPLINTCVTIMKG
jgi:hypothetical protein